MSLSNLAVFNDHVYTTITELLREQIDIFNAASRGAISLKVGANTGDYSERSIFGAVSGLVRRRNAYGTGSVSQKSLSNLSDISVKIAAGTPEIAIDPGQWRWIQQSPEIASAAISQQLAKAMMADMLNAAIASTASALAGVTDVVHDVTGATPNTFGVDASIDGAAKFGDRAGDITAWILHSASMTKWHKAAAANATNLYTYGSINVIGDPFGRIFVVTDSPSLVVSGSPNTYLNLGLVPGAVEIEDNQDFDAVTVEKTGNENIARTYQAEWSYNCRVKGFAWDKTIKSPTDLQIASSANWDRYSTSVKDLAGVLVKSH